MDKGLLDILACPNCKGKLLYDHKAQELICQFDQLGYPIKDDIPIMLIDEARKIYNEHERASTQQFPVKG